MDATPPLPPPPPAPPSPPPLPPGNDLASEQPQTFFSNDGSFMERFLAMQKKQAEETGAVEEKKGATLVSTSEERKKSIALSATKSQPHKLKPSGKVGFSLSSKKIKAPNPAKGWNEDDVSPTSETAGGSSETVPPPTVPPTAVARSSRKRKNRWDSGPAVKPQTTTGGGGDSVDGAPRAGALLSEPSAQATEQLRVQKEMQFLEQRVRSMQRSQAMRSGGASDAAITLDLHEERLGEYERLAALDNDGPRDTADDAEEKHLVDGSWEHRKRAKEMLSTAESAFSATISARANAKGSRHLGSYLPKEEMDKFLQRVKAVKSGQTLAAGSDFEKNKLGSDNLGYQMLSKAGWNEGQGLGSSSSGIVQPVNVVDDAVGQRQGVGAEKPGEVAADDDEFDAYRKRMMLAYRFRPNPMNNPRRSYY